MMIDVLRPGPVDGFFPSPFLRSNIVTNEKKRENSRDYIFYWQRANLYSFCSI